MVENESSTGYEQGAALEGPDKGSILHIEADNFDGLDNWTCPVVQFYQRESPTKVVQLIPATSNTYQAKMFIPKGEHLRNIFVSQPGVLDTK